MTKKVLNYVFIVLILLAMLVCVDPDTLIDSANTNIVVPYIKVKGSIVIFVITMLGLFLVLTNKVFKIDLILLLLLLRAGIYFIPIIFMKQSYSFGTILSAFQCMVLYFIGLNFKGEFKNLMKILIVFSLIIIGEELYVLIYRGISLFSPSLKYYMVLPLGRYNYLTCFLLPIYFLVDTYYKDRKYFKLKLIYTAIIFFGVLATGSKWAFVLFLMYFILKFIMYLTKVKINRGMVKYYLIGFAIFLIMLIIGVTYLVSNSDIITRYFQFSTFEPRLRVYYEGILLFLEEPIFGRGSAPYQIYDAVSAHNFILESLIQTGMIGTIIYIFILILVLNLFLKIKDKKMKTVTLVFYFGVLIQGMAEPALFGLCFDTFFWFLIGYLVHQSRLNIRKKDEMFLF